MSSYLTIASKVLKRVQKPLSAQQILQVAYQFGMVPPHLYGKTQHKTLQARLSEDILRMWDRSEFVRTAPGRFSLRGRSNRDGLGKQEELPYIAPLRSEQLKKYYVACARRDALRGLSVTNPGYIANKQIGNIIAQYKLLSSIKKQSDLVPISVFVLLFRFGDLMVHRSISTVGKSRETQLTVGFSGYVKAGDQNFFSTDQFGIKDAAVRTLSEKLRVRATEVQKIVSDNELSIVGFMSDGSEMHDIRNVVAITSCRYEHKRDPWHLEKLARFEEWQPATRIRNDLFRFDSWSQHLFSSGKILEIAESHD